MMGGGSPQMFQSDNIAGIGKKEKAHFSATATTNITNHPTTINCLYMGGHVKTLDNKRLQTNSLSVIATIPLLDDRSPVE